MCEAELKDAKARRLVLAADQSFIVQAPAGSGKTGLLIMRYLLLLTRVKEPEEVLAITFTRKATHEMRVRIVNALKAAADGTNEHDIMPSIVVLARAVLTHSERRNWRLLDNICRCRIQTIDALCSELVRRMPWSSQFGTVPRTLDNATTYYHLAALNTLAHIDQHSSAAASAAVLFELVDADFNRALELLMEMLAKRDKWLRLLPAQPRETLQLMWRRVLETHLSRIRQQLLPFACQLAHLYCHTAQRIYENENKKQNTPPPDYNLKVLPEANITVLDQWHGIAALLFTRSGKLRKRVNKRDGFLPQDKEEKATLYALLKQLEQQPELVSSLHSLVLLPDASFNQSQWNTLQALFKLLPLAASELRLLFKQHNVADYTEISHRASLALGKPEAPTDLALVLDYRLSHVLMDEFQDTSFNQLELLTGLIAGWQEGDGRTLFLVGDPMQSIYRFREAEVGIFLDVQQRGLGNIVLQPLTLETNFRSNADLVKWFNVVFSEVFPSHDNLYSGAVSYNASIAAHGPAHDEAVTLHPTVTDNAEPATIVHQVHHTLTTYPDQTIAIMGRARHHLVAVVAALKAARIDYQAVDLETLAHRPAIQDLIALTRALIHPCDRVAWLSILHAPWCGLTLKDLSHIAGHDRHATIIECGQDPTLRKILSPGSYARLQKTYHVITAATDKAVFESLSMRVESAWLALGGPACVAAQEIENCDTFFEILKNIEDQRQIITPQILEQEISRLYVQTESSAKVQVMTIHKAKGLEFDHVFMVGLERQVKTNDKPLLRWASFPEELLFAPRPASTDKQDLKYKYLQRLDNEQISHENQRLLYVATTRARNKLHLFARLKTGKADYMQAPPPHSLLNLFWPALAEQFIAAVDKRDVVMHQQPTTAKRQLKRLPDSWQLPEQPQDIQFRSSPVQAESIEFSWVGESARIIGVVAHQLLRLISTIGWEKWCDREFDMARWRCLLQQHFIASQDIDQALLQLKHIMNNIKIDPTAVWLFKSSHRGVKAEWPLTGIIDSEIKHVVIDRSFIDNQGIRWIIDYKTSSHLGGHIDEFMAHEKERYHKQLQTYASLVRGLEKRPIKLALYYPMMPAWCEWEDTC